MSKHNKTSISTTKKILLCIFFSVFIIITALAFFINNYLNKIKKINLDTDNFQVEETSSNDKTYNDSEAIPYSNDIKNIALFGIDETEGTPGRSDCIMIFTIDNKHNNLKLTSIVRDSYVTIPTKPKKDKINHAYAFGGPKLALQTINENFDLNINQFVTVNFSSLPKIIDDIGGITLNITDDELKYINNYIQNLNELNNTNSPSIISSGTQKIDGTQALAYSRIRYTAGGDFERSQRHRTVINQLMQKIKTISGFDYPKLLDELLPLVHTNLEKSDMISLIMKLNSLKDQPLNQEMFPNDEDGTGKNIDGIYYYVFDENLTKEKIHNFIFEN